MEAVCNGVKATIKSKNWEKDKVTREWCFVTHSTRDRVTEKGDSGAPLLDENFQPIAMLWGGDECGHGFQDVTYGTPLYVVLRDIERRMGWEAGSVQYC
jgi:hypothetical protein